MCTLNKSGSSRDKTSWQVSESDGGSSRTCVPSMASDNSRITLFAFKVD